MKSLWFKALPFLACMLIAAGCSSYSKLGNIVVDITGYRTTPTPNQAQLTLRYTNENVFPIAIAETKGKLYLNGEYIGSFNQREAVGIPQLSTATRSTNLQIEKPDVLQKILATNPPSVSYRLETIMPLEVSEERIKVTADFKGQLETSALRSAPDTTPKN